MELPIEIWVDAACRVTMAGSGVEVGQHFEQTFLVLECIVRGNAFFDAGEGRGETFGFDWFGEVVERVDFKSADRILIVCGYKYREGYTFGVVPLAL
jgi:hypothetical protein